jgi:hypothetical protein
MLRAHVFIVNEITLPTHLEYMFVGTTAGTKDSNISLLADMYRVKAGDLVFFYIEATNYQKGRFFGVFKVRDDVTYHLAGEDAYNPNLPVKLVYRRRVQPYKVYPKGVLEWIALDKLPTYSKELLWSLIYRKMKAKRGNTMLLPWETERLVNLIEDANDGVNLESEDFTYNRNCAEIEEGNNTREHNIGNEVDLPIDVAKKNETSLQAALLKKLNVNNNDFLPNIFGRNIVWLGNEVFAGSGMQKIDILTIEQKDQASYLYRIIELKHPKSAANLNFAPSQLEYYVKWAQEDCGGHIIGGRKFNIKPILLNFSASFSSTAQDVIDGVKRLSSISKEPEVWEVDYSFNSNPL